MNTAKIKARILQLEDLIKRNQKLLREQRRELKYSELEDRLSKIEENSK